MRISQKAEYALRAMLDLAMNAETGQPVRSSAIAERARVPEKFLEAILVDLRKAGLVRSRRGPEGGHQLARPAARISVGEIRQAIDGPLSLTSGSKSRGRNTDPVDACMKEFWSEIEDTLRIALGEVSLEELRRRADQQRGVLDFSI